MAQYHRLKKQAPADAFLLFRLGDFYEMFFDDARNGAPILQISLTKRGETPMCGIPFHAASGYISRLLKAGRKVAICEQIEEAKPGKLVQRDITQILSPGTHFDEKLLVEEKNNFIAAVTRSGRRFGLAVVDLTTGEFKATELEDEMSLASEVERLRPAEIVVADDDAKTSELLAAVVTLVSPYEGWVFQADNARFALLEHFKVATLDGFGLKKLDLATGASGAVVHYLGQNLRRDLSNLTGISVYRDSEHLAIDAISLRNLEILEPLQPDAPRAASLFRALNRTVTPMGARRLREWLIRPLSEPGAIRSRQAVVEALLESPDVLESLREELADVRDLERIVSRLSNGSGNARDLAALRVGLEKLPAIRATVSRLASGAGNGLLNDGGSSADGLLTQLVEDLSELPELVAELASALVDEPPLTLREGGMIRDGFHAGLDELRSASRDGKDWIARLQRDEIERTQIPSLKVRYNAVFGYFIEVTRTHLDKVPENYVRKQTIANGERFFTPELKEIEGKILGSEERSVKLEYELFQDLRARAVAELATIQASARVISQLDVLAAFAETARLYNHCRPDVRDEGVLLVEEGRHPVLDQAVSEEPFVPNDTRLDVDAEQLAIITGPNMAGKSTYIRQVALLSLLAHTGSFVPARSARIDLVDRIFTRIGASDDLARGQSTFMVEMSETANILNNATRRSLIILDEIGRGTSTFDGLSLAWSIVEFLHNAVGAKTLFASHYHELTELASRLPRVRNYNVAVREYNDQIVFLRKIVEGGTDKSYGIQVARLAGVPKPVLTRAKEILRNLEESELTPVGSGRAVARRNADREKLKQLPGASQLDLFAGAGG